MMMDFTKSLSRHCHNYLMMLNILLTPGQQVHILNDHSVDVVLREVCLKKLNIVGMASS